MTVADVKISELDPAISLDGTEILELGKTVSGSLVPRRTTTQDIADLANAGPSAGSLFAEGAAPASPATGTVIQYAKIDGKLYYKDDAGAETAIGGGMANPMTTAGDLIVGGASGAAGRLAKGANTNVLTMVSGAVAWAAASSGGAASGVSFNTTATGVTSTNVQGAIDEIFGDISSALAAIIGGP